MFRMTDISQLKTRVFHEILLIVVFLENIEFGVTPLDVWELSLKITWVILKYVLKQKAHIVGVSFDIT